MRTTDFDKLARSKPFKDAALQIAHGEGDAPKLHKPARIFWTEEPELKKFTGEPEHDIRGLVLSNGTVVVGLLNHTRDKHAQWVIRCACGIYETRKYRVIRRNLDPLVSNACGFCSIKIVRQRADFKRRTGLGLGPDQKPIRS